jgi:hypothetical protein
MNGQLTRSSTKPWPAFPPAVSCFFWWRISSGHEKICARVCAPQPARARAREQRRARIRLRHFNPKTLNLRKEQIPTITVVDDTFEKHRDVMAEIIQNAKERVSQ